MESICDGTCFCKYSPTFEYPRVIHHWAVIGRFLAFASSVEGLSVPEQYLVDALCGTCLGTGHIEVSCMVVNNCLGASFGLVWKLIDAKGLNMINSLLEVPCLASSLGEKSRDDLLEVDAHFQNSLRLIKRILPRVPSLPYITCW